MGLLAGGQLADLLTTHVDMSRGAVEANQMAASLMSSGGLVLLTIVKLLLVAAMTIAVILVESYAGIYPGRRARMARSVVWGGLQVSVVILAATALHNVAVLAQIQGWLPASAGAALPLLTN
jgi:hypothetical protein